MFNTNDTHDTQMTIQLYTDSHRQLNQIHNIGAIEYSPLYDCQKPLQTIKLRKNECR